MDHEYQNAASIGIIGGADGPTSVFIAGKKEKIPFKVRVNKYLYQRKREKMAKKIVPGTHTLDELIAYAKDTYDAKRIKKEPGESPIACQIYEIKAGGNCLEIEIDNMRGAFGVSFSGNKRAMKHFQKIAKDLYVYYGVSEADISQKTERYFSLLGVLSM